MAYESIIVDRKLAGIKINKLLEYRNTIRDKGKIELPTDPNEVRPIIDDTLSDTPDNELVLIPNKLYPSNNPSTFFYIPKYRLLFHDPDNPAVELKYEGDEDVAGSLTLIVTWSEPRHRSDTFIRTMDHLTDISLKFRVPVGGQDNGTTSGHGIENTIALQPLQQLGDFKAKSTTTFYDKHQFNAVYQAMRDPSRSARLYLSISAKIGLRTWKQTTVSKANNKDQIKALIRNKALYTNMLRVKKENRVSIPANKSSIRFRNKKTTAADTAKIKTARMMIANPGLVRAQPAARTSRTHVTPSARTVPVTRMRTNPELVRAMAATTPRPQPVMAAQPPTLHASMFVATPATFHMQPATVATAKVTPKKKSKKITRKRTSVRTKTAARRKKSAPSKIKAKSRRTVKARSHPTGITATRHNNKMDPQLTAALMNKVYSPNLMLATVKASNIKIHGNKVVPVFIPMAINNKPAIITTELENKQRLGFSFPVDVASRKNSNVYNNTGGLGSEAIHLLLPIRLQDNSGDSNPKTFTVYQDNLMPDVIHIVPTEFRMLRDDNAPYLPSMAFLPSDFATADNEEETEVLFRMSVVYKIDPWLDPLAMQLAREELLKQNLIARFTPVNPQDASLTLDLDLLGDEKKRDSVTIDASSAITDTLDLSHDDFVNLWRNRLSLMAGGGINGKIHYKLFDGSQATSKVTISLSEESSDFFETSFAGPVSGKPGHYLVIVRNRIESPVTIKDIASYRVDKDVIAHPVNETSLNNTTLQPQETLHIEYLVEPQDYPVEYIDPAITGSSSPVASTLLKMMMAKPGYSSLSFPLTIKAADDTFTQTDDESEIITGLLVEFDDGTRVTLTPGDDEQEVTLVGRLIDQILGTADEQQRFFYRITNLHAIGEGARTSWYESQASVEELEVTPAFVKATGLDF